MTDSWGKNNNLKIFKGLFKNQKISMYEQIKTYLINQPSLPQPRDTVIHGVVHVQDIVLLECQGAIHTQTIEHGSDIKGVPWLILNFLVP